jgi:hypothetical protein
LKAYPKPLLWAEATSALSHPISVYPDNSNKRHPISLEVPSLTLPSHPYLSQSRAVSVTALSNSDAEMGAIISLSLSGRVSLGPLGLGIPGNGPLVKWASGQNSHLTPSYLSHCLGIPGNGPVVKWTSGQNSHLTLSYLSHSRAPGPGHFQDWASGQMGQRLKITLDAILSLSFSRTPGPGYSRDSSRAGRKQPDNSSPNLEQAQPARAHRPRRPSPASTPEADSGGAGDANGEGRHGVGTGTWRVGRRERKREAVTSDPIRHGADAPVHVELAPRRREAVVVSGRRTVGVERGRKQGPGPGGGVEGVQVVESDCGRGCC